ncbi:MAG: O-antigen ligase family protein [Candidatus Omnitrophica bacterium]|nr:O-antigen ligase family protein [Candidatus Omnitrophota bacterium]
MSSVQFQLPNIHGEVLPFSLLEAISFFILFIFLLGQFLENKLSFVSIPVVTLFLFLFLLILQFFPLSQGILGLFSPATLSIYKGFSLGSGNPLTLSIYPEASVTWLLPFLSYLAIFFVVLNYLDSKSRCKRLIWIIIITAFVYSFYGISYKLLQIATGTNINVASKGFSTFTYRNNFAAYLEMVIPLVISYSFITFSFNKKLVLMFMGTIMIAALFFTSSRGGRISFGISFLVFFVILFLRMKNLRKKIATYLSIFSIFLVILVLLIGLSNLLFRMGGFFVDKVDYSRNHMNTESIQIVKDFPFFGTGLGTYWEIANKYKTADWNGQHPFAHNEPLQLLVETGFVGFLLFTLFLFFYFRKVYDKWSGRNDPYVVVMTLGCATGILSILIHSFSDWVFHLPANSFIFFILMALVYRIVYLKEDPGLSDIPKRGVFLTKNTSLVLICILFISLISIEILIFRRYRAQEVFEKVVDYRNNHGIHVSSLVDKVFVEEIDLAIRLNSSNSLYWNTKAELLTQLALMQGSVNDLNGSIEKETLLLTAKSCYKKAINLNPTKAVFHCNLGKLFGLCRENELLFQEFKKASLLEPRNKDIINLIKNFTF